MNTRQYEISCRCFVDGSTPPPRILTLLISSKLWISGESPPWTHRNCWFMSAASGRQSNASIQASYTRSEYFILPETDCKTTRLVGDVQPSGRQYRTLKAVGQCSNWVNLNRRALLSHKNRVPAQVSTLRSVSHDFFFFNHYVVWKEIIKTKSDEQIEKKMVIKNKFDTIKT